MKTLQIALISFPFLLMASIALAQTSSITPNLDETSPFYNFQFFANYQLPLGLHQFGNIIGIAPDDVISQDYENIATELQLENADLVEKYTNNQVDDSTFQTLENSIMNSEDDAVSNLEITAQSTLSTNDDVVLGELEKSESEMISVESQSGINIEQSLESSSSAESSSSESASISESSSSSSEGGGGSE